MPSRVLAALLCALLAASPAAAAARAVAPTQLKATAPQAVFNALPVLQLPAQAFTPLAPLSVVPEQANVLPHQPALTTLRETTAPDVAPEHTGLRFDGAKEAAKNISPVVPVVASETSSAPRLDPPAPQAPKQPGFFRRLNAATDNLTTAGRRFEIGVELGLLAGLALPLALKMEPALNFLTTAPLALASMVAVFGLVTLGRAAKFIVTRRDPVRRKSSPKKIALALALGLAVGGGIAYSPHAYERPFVVFAETLLHPGANIVAVPGNDMARAVETELARNPVGRDVLDGLRDRLGVVRMPKFYVGATADAVARYNGAADSVTVDAPNILQHGWTVKEFLADPAKQAAFAKAHIIVLAHELRHAGQARRPIYERGVVYDVMNFEAEYEAYLTEHFYAFEQLKADPAAELENDANGALLAPMDDLEGYLRGTDSSYPKNIHIDTPRYRRWYAELRAGWPRHEVDVYLLMAKRWELRGGHPRLVDMYLNKARATAEKHGLPRP